MAGCFGTRLFKKKNMEIEAISLLKWMRKNEVSIATDENGDFAFDIGVDNYSAETLYEKFKSEDLQNKETLEEAVLNSNEHDNLKSEDGTYLSFHKQSELLLKGAEIGAKWQQERMDSEEEVYNKLHNLMTEIKLNSLVINDDMDLKQWFNQNKK